MGLNISLANTHLPNHPEITTIFSMFRNDPQHNFSGRGGRQRYDLQRSKISIVEDFCKTFPDTEPSFVAAMLLSRFRYVPSGQEENHYRGIISEECLDHLKAINAIWKGMDHSSIDLCRYALFSERNSVNYLIDDISKNQRDFFKAAKDLQDGEDRLLHLRGKTGRPDLEGGLSASFIKAKQALEPARKNLPSALQSFEQSGLPDHEIIIKAYHSMLKHQANGIASNVTHLCNLDVNLAKEVQSWSSEPEVIALALMRGPYQAHSYHPERFSGEWDESFIQQMKDVDPDSADIHGNIAEGAKVVILADKLMRLESKNNFFNGLKDKDVADAMAGKSKKSGASWQIFTDMLPNSFYEHESLVAWMYAAFNNGVPCPEDPKILVRLNEALQNGQDIVEKFNTLYPRDYSGPEPW